MLYLCEEIKHINMYLNKNEFAHKHKTSWTKVDYRIKKGLLKANSEGMIDENEPFPKNFKPGRKRKYPKR